MTQLPLPDTMVDFWTMMIDHGSQTIVLMLENADEVSPNLFTILLTAVVFNIKDLKKKHKSLPIGFNAIFTIFNGFPGLYLNFYL